MYFKDHGPPRFHALYAEFEALIHILDLAPDAIHTAIQERGEWMF